MPQLLILAVAGVGLWAGYRWLQREQARVADDLRRAEDMLKERTEGHGRAPGKETVQQLEYDEASGEYRVK